MNHKNLILFLGILLAPGVRPSSAAPSGGVPTVEISVSDTDIALGDSVAVRCMVTVPTGVAAGEPSAEENPLLELERRSGTEEKSSAGTVRTYEYLAYVFSPDSLRVGPFAVHYVTAAGDSGQVLSGTLMFRVAGFMKAPEDSLKPSRGPLDIPGKGIPAGIFAFLAALLAAAAIWFFLKRRKRPAPVKVVERPLDEIGEFEHIRALHLGEKGQVKELYAQVSGTMRGFVHRNMGFEALYSTTDEIRRKLRGWRDRETADAIRAIFEESDMVKFAKYIPSEEQAATVIDRAIIPARKVLEQIAAERERERIAEEERRRAAAPSDPGGPADPVAGGEGVK